MCPQCTRVPQAVEQTITYLIHTQSKRLLPVVMGASTILGVFPMLVLINATYSTTFYILGAFISRKENDGAWLPNSHAING